jgi:hydrogenase maturation protease
MSRPRILVAGIGNIFLGDDAFGVHVAQRLAGRVLPEDVRVVDFGIRGLDLAYALTDGYEAVLLIDAAPRGGPPGTLYVLQPTADAAADEGEAAVETHGMDPVKVLRLARALGGSVGSLYVVGCEPAPSTDPEEMQLAMSEPVQAAVDEAVPLVESIVGRLLQGLGVEVQ